MKNPTKTKGAAHSKAHQRRPWTRNGVALGFWRGPVAWIDRTVLGKRWRVSTGCRSADAAWDEYQRFERDPANFTTRTAVREGSGWDEAVLACLAHKRDIEGCTARYLDGMAAQLERWGKHPAFVSLDTFTQRDVEGFLTDLVQGKVTSRMVRDPKTGALVRKVTSMQASKNRYLAALKSLMTWARARVPPITTNMADTLVALGKEDAGGRPVKFIEPERWQAVAPHLPEKWRMAQEMLLGSGLRWGELARLTEEDVQPRGVIVRKAKSGKGRVVPVSERTVQAATTLLKLGGVPDDSAGQMNQRLDAACRAAGVRRYTAHNLRHTFGTTCLRNKMDVRTVSAWLGHASLSTTLRYLHAVQLLDGLDRVVAPL